MKKILRYLWFVLCTVSYSSAYANTCDIDPNECTPKKLCEAATIQNNGNTIWTNTSAFSKHIDYAKALGLNCGVVKLIDLCDSDPGECKIDDLCRKATTDNNDRKSWNKNADTYVKLAKKYGLTCDVKVTQTVDQQCTLDNKKACSSPDILCALATTILGWETHSAFQQYVIEAEREGLDCGIIPASEVTEEICLLDNQEACTNDDFLCRMATQNNEWLLDDASLQYVKKAISLDLDCGTNTIEHGKKGAKISTLPTCTSLNPSGLFFHCFSSDFVAGSGFEGEYKGMLRHGKGVVRNPYFKQVGTWEAGKEVGQFITTYANGDKYLLTQADDETLVKRINLSSIKVQERAVLGGQEVNANQKGNFQYSSGDTLFFNWIDGYGTGPVTLSFSNGDKFFGTYNKVGSGLGTLYFVNGNKYEGSLSLRKMHGKGTLTFLNGDTYSGEFAFGKIGEQGTWVYTTGDKYSGGFVNGERHGNGVLEYSNGDKYYGNFFKGLRQGKGEFIRQDGTKLTGFWKNDNFVPFEKPSKSVETKAIKLKTNPPDDATQSKCKLDNKNACTNSDMLCALATTTRGWETHLAFRQYVKEAKRRGLTCGVKVQVAETPKPKSCRDDPSSCTDQSTCYFGTQFSDGIKAWQTQSKYRKHVAEAERRGLTCGVVKEKTCLEDWIKCSNAELCTYGTKKTSNNKVWITKYFSSNFAKEAKRRGLTCGVGNTGRLPDCPSSGIRNNCFGTYDWEDGAKYVGEWKNGKRHGQGSYIHSSGDISIGEWIDSERKGESVYIWKSGGALFESNWQPTSTSDSTVQKMFPYLVRQFNSFSKDNRKELQRSLQRKGLYSSTVDGQWGRNTLIGFARFSSEYMRTVNLKDNSTVDEVIDAIYKQGNLSKVKPASKSLLDSIATKKNMAAKVLANAYQLENTFKGYTALSRKQIQWALRERGYYKSSIDGLWGKGTETAVVQYTQDAGFDARYPTSIYSQIKDGMNVPSSFAVARKPSQSNQGSGVGAGGKIVLLGAICALTPDPLACLAGAANAVTGNESPDYSSGSSGSSSSSFKSGLVRFSGNRIYHSDGSSSRISSSGNRIYHSDGSSSRVSSNGRKIYNSDGTTCRVSISGKRITCY